MTTIVTCFLSVLFIRFVLHIVDETWASAYRFVRSNELVLIYYVFMFLMTFMVMFITSAGIIQNI